MSVTRRLRERVRGSIAADLPGLRGARAVLAVSGGADSCAMAVLLMGVVARDSVIAHFDHCLQGGAASASERRVVDALGARLALRVVHGEWRSPRRGEAAARDARHAFLRDVAIATGAAGAATGHTADDQAETVLMRIARGSGVHGLAGMRADVPWHADPSRRLWRPLLGVGRVETRALCAAEGIVFHDDATNEDRRLQRNRIRLDVLPALERGEPGARRALLELAERARSVAAAMDAATLAALTSLQGDGASGVRIARDEACALPPELLTCAFRRALGRLMGSARDIDRRHYATFAQAVRGRTGATYEFPGGVRLTVDADTLLLTRGAPCLEAVPSDFEAALPFRGRAGAWELDARPASSEADATLLAPSGAVLRCRRLGDRVRLAGGSRKLKDVLIDRKVPRRARDSAPVIAMAGEVFWTPHVTGAHATEGVPYVVRAREVRQ